MSELKKMWNFIEPEIEVKKGEYCPYASYVRKEFTIASEIREAKLYITALGVFKAYVNGKEVDQSYLLPGFTNYHKRLQYKIYDIKDQLSMGKNAVGAIIGNGWYRGNLGAFNVSNVYGEKIKLAAFIEIKTTENEILICTDESWKATQEGSVRDNDLKSVEILDMRIDMSGWSCPDFPDDTWHKCVNSTYGGDIIAFEGEDVLEHEVFIPKVIKTTNGETVLDFGQNHTGHVEFRVEGISGHEICLEMGETLDENGDFTVKNVAGTTKKETLPFQTFKCILKDGLQICKPMFLVCGYRYVRVTNWPRKIMADDFRSYALYSGLKEIGSFECSDPSINQFVSNVNWSRKSNFVDIPTDCPTRERAGWTGDINVFAETACYTTDPRNFLKKWYQDVLSMQLDNGAIPYIVPSIPMPLFKSIDEKKLYSPAGWADVVCNLPMVLYQFFADDTLIKENYPQIRSFVEHNLERAKKRHKLHLLKRGKHYKYILDTGFQFGEWLEPGGNMLTDTLKAFVLPDSEVATAWLYHSTRQLAQMASIIKCPSDEMKYLDISEKIKDAYQKEFLKRGTVSSKRQCKYVRPIYMGLLSDKQAVEAAKKLNDLCIENNYKIATGFLTTYKLLQVLTQYGYADCAYRILLQKECPGWMYEIEKGATTIWENWLGIKENGTPENSLNHYAPGAALSWLYSDCAGIRPMEPGFSKIQIRPIPGGKLRWVKASYESVHGLIRSEWHIEGEKFVLEVDIPIGISCEIILPDNTIQVLEGGGHISCSCNNVN